MSWVCSSHHITHWLNMFRQSSAGQEKKHTMRDILFSAASCFIKPIVTYWLTKKECFQATLDSQCCDVFGSRHRPHEDWTSQDRWKLLPTSSIHFCDRKPQKSLRKRTGIGDKHREKTLSQCRKLQVWVSWVMLRSDVMICQNACNVCQNWLVGAAPSRVVKGPRIREQHWNKSHVPCNKAADSRNLSASTFASLCLSLQEPWLRQSLMLITG